MTADSTASGGRDARRSRAGARAHQCEWLFFAGLAAAAGMLAVLRPDKAIDFRVYFENARHYFAGVGAMYGPQSGTGRPDGVFRYPPIFLDLFRPLSILPLRWGAALWAAGKLLCGGALVIGLRRRWGLASIVAFWPALLLVTPYFIQELRYGNAQFYIVALCVLAFLIAGDRPVQAGCWLGLAAALKIWPLFFFPCLFARRRWRFLAAASAAVVVWTLLPVLWRGWTAQWTLLHQWLAQERTISLTNTQAGELWYPGQSLHDVMARFLSVVDYSRLPDTHYPQVAWLHLSSPTVELLWWGLTALLLAGLFYLLARSVRPVEAAWKPRISETGGGAAQGPAPNKRSSGMGHWGPHAGASISGTGGGAAQGPAPNNDAAVALMFCAVLVIEPHVHRLVLETLLWPALWLAVERTRRRWPGSLRFWWWMAVAASILQPLIPGSARQRVMQAYGVDFWLVLAPLTLLTIQSLRLRQRPDWTRAAADPH